MTDDAVAPVCTGRTARAVSAAATTTAMSTTAAAATGVPAAAASTAPASTPASGRARNRHDGETSKDEGGS